MKKNDELRKKAQLFDVLSQWFDEWYEGEDASINEVIAKIKELLEEL